MTVRIDPQAFAGAIRRALAATAPATAPAAEPWLSRLVDAGTAAIEDEAAASDFSIHSPLPR